MELKMMVDDGVVYMICFEEVLESARALLRILFDFVYADCGNVNSGVRRVTCPQEAREAETQRLDAEHAHPWVKSCRACQAALM